MIGMTALSARASAAPQAANNETTSPSIFHSAPASKTNPRVIAAGAMVLAIHAALLVLLIGGVPLKEPVVRYGPFVMNTEDEIRQAVIDYQAGRMGAITH